MPLHETSKQQSENYARIERLRRKNEAEGDYIRAYYEYMKGLRDAPHWPDYGVDPARGEELRDQLLRGTLFLND